jgi:hypothetical protein
MPASGKGWREGLMVSVEAGGIVFVDDEGGHQAGFIIPSAQLSASCARVRA